MKYSIRIWISSIVLGVSAGLVLVNCSNFPIVTRGQILKACERSGNISLIIAAAVESGKQFADYEELNKVMKLMEDNIVECTKVNPNYDIIEGNSNELTHSYLNME